MPHVLVNGVEVFYRDEGEGTPIILGHCSTGSSGQWRDLIATLAASRRCLAPDHFGYGKTQPYSSSPSLLDNELAVIEQLLALAGDRAHFVGHSYGGSVLARAAVRWPERVLSLTLIEPTLFYLPEMRGEADEVAEINAVAERMTRYVNDRNLEEAARVFIDYWSGPGTYDAMPPERRVSVTSAITKVRDEWEMVFESRGATPEQLAALDCPITLISGEHTTRAGAAVMRVLREIWPTAQYQEIPGAGHLSPISHSTLVNPIVQRFVA
jgi:pimeloyl-ACP methyl ester carboxylesterase